MSDIETLERLKALDPKRPIREADIDLRRFVPLAEVATTFAKKKTGSVVACASPSSPIPFFRVQLVCGANTNNIGVMFMSGYLDEAAMKPTDQDDEKFASLKRETLPTFVLAALIFMLTVVGALRCVAGAAADQGRSYRSRQQDRQDGLGHDGQRRALQRTRRARGVIRSRRTTGAM